MFPKCPNCGEANLEQHRRRADLLMCPLCWHKYDKKAALEGRFIRVKKKVKRANHEGRRPSVEARLRCELKRLKERADAGHELRVVWSPSQDSKLSGEVKGGVVYIYEPDEVRAVNALRHEYIDYLVSQAIEPYRSVTNKLIRLLNEVAYKKKEEVVEALVKLL